MMAALSPLERTLLGVLNGINEPLMLSSNLGMKQQGLLQ